MTPKQRSVALAAALEGDAVTAMAALDAFLPGGCHYSPANEIAAQAAADALDLAAAFGSRALCEGLLARGVLADSDNSRALSSAAAAGHAEICAMLLVAGASPHKTIFSTGPLRAGREHLDVLRCLISHGANPQGFHWQLVSDAFHCMTGADADLVKALHPRMTTSALISFAYSRGRQELAESLEAELARSSDAAPRLSARKRSVVGPHF